MMDCVDGTNARPNNAARSSIEASKAIPRTNPLGVVAHASMLLRRDPTLSLSKALIHPPTALGTDDFMPCNLGDLRPIGLELIDVLPPRFGHCHSQYYNV